MRSPVPGPASSTIPSSTDGAEDRLLRAMTDKMIELFPRTRGEVVLVGVGSAAPDVASSWGDQPPTATTLEMSAIRRCLGMRRGGPYVVPDVEDRSVLACPAHPGRRGSVLCVPMLALGEMVGVIHVEDDRRAAYRLDARHRAAELADRTALAVFAARRPPLGAPNPATSPLAQPTGPSLGLARRA